MLFALNIINQVIHDTFRCYVDLIQDEQLFMELVQRKRNSQALSARELSQLAGRAEFQ